MQKWFVLLAMAACTGGNPGDSAAPDAPMHDPGADAGVDAPAPPPITVLRVVDRATALSLAEAHTLATTHGVNGTGVYIGGAGDGRSGLAQELAANLHNQ